MHRLGGAGAHERFTYDFVVDGVSLADALNVRKFGLVGCFDVMENKWNTHAAKALLLKEPPDVAPDRVMIYVCPGPDKRDNPELNWGRTNGTTLN